MLSRFTLLLVIFAFTPFSQATPWRICHETIDFKRGTTPSTPTPSIASLLIKSVLDASTKTQIDIELMPLPWKRCLHLAENGEVDGLFSIIRTPEREKIYAFPNDDSFIRKADYIILYAPNSRLHQADITGKLFNQDGGFNLELYKQIKELGLQAPNGYVVQQYLKDHNIIAKYDYNLESAISQIASGKLDGYVVDREVATTNIIRYGLAGKVLVSSNALKEYDWHLGFNKAFYLTNQDSVDRFWKALTVSSEKILVKF